VTPQSETEENFALLASKRLDEACQKTLLATKMKNRAMIAGEYEKFGEMVEQRKRLCAVEQKVCFALIGVFGVVIITGVIVLTCLYLI